MVDDEHNHAHPTNSVEDNKQVEYKVLIEMAVVEVVVEP